MTWLLWNSMVEEQAAIRDSHLEGSIAGRRAHARGISGRANVGDDRDIGA